MSTPQKQPRPALKAVRGTRDLLPDQTPLWNRVESTARAVFARYGFGEIRTPIFESTDLFARGVGEETDIVSKEMFTWEDRERFDKPSLIKHWLEKTTLSQVERNARIEDQKVDLLARQRINTPHGIGLLTQLVEFKSEFRHQDVAQLSMMLEAFDRQNHSEVIVRQFQPSNQLIGRLVVPSNRNATESIQPYKNIVVEYVEGNFFMSSQTLTLRPENTAGVVRSYIEHKLGETGHLQKLYYIGPQFRRERPQRGRYRQFWQIGAEVIGPQSSGSESPLRDAEILEMLASLLNELGIRDWRLELNSVGNAEDRARYNAALREALQPVKHLMCEDNQRRADLNPLRVLDSKDEADQEIINNLPKIADYLSPESRAHFDAVLAALDACAVPYHLNPRLVRGLDYYTRTTFEFTVTTGLGTQNALLGGGRYDGLSEMLGGPRAPGIGFAIGEDRLILTLQAQMEADRAAAAESAQSPTENTGASNGAAAPHLASEMWARTKLDAYIAPLGPAQNPAALSLAHDLRSAGLTVEVGDGSFKLRKHFDTADTLARHILLLGEDELATNTVTLKTFATGEQKKIARAEVIAALRHP